jgi:choline kinase
MIKNAIILAAGQGKRLKGFNNTKHKSQLKIGNRTFLELSVQKLLSSGIQQVFIVVGFESNYVAQSLGTQPSHKIKFVENSEFAISGNLVSLIKGLHHIEGPCLFLDADIIYESRIISELLDFENANIFITSKPCGSGDEVLVSSTDGFVDEISKTPKIKSSELSEFIGITSISEEVVHHLKELDLSDFSKYDYEPYLNEILISKFKFKEHFVPELKWSEVDKAADWNRIDAWDESTISRIMQI